MTCTWTVYVLVLAPWVLMIIQLILIGYWMKTGYELLRLITERQTVVEKMLSKMFGKFTGLANAIKKGST